MLKTILIALLPLLIFFSNGSDRSFTKINQGTQQETGTLEKMIVANGTVAMDLNLTRLNGSNLRAKESRSGALQFDVRESSFFKVLVFNGEFRGMLPSSMDLVPRSQANLPTKLRASYEQLVVESLPWGGSYELAVTDSKTGFRFFNIEGQEFQYESGSRTLDIQLGRLLISDEFAAELGRPSDAGSIVGQISVRASLQPIEVTQVDNGETTSDVLPGLGPESGTTPGPDVVVGDLSGLAQFGGSSGTQVGLAVGTDSCNYGVENLHWFANPENDHPVIPQNLYRMSGGTSNNDRFEQIGQSSVKHAFTALTNNICNLGCNGVGGANLGSGCSDPYGASLNAGPSLGSRAWINPFTGAYPRNDGATPNNSHTGHAHTGPSHRILTEIADLVPAQNPGATYYAEGQYITPHEYVWCQSHPGQCNMNNNVSYRQYSVTNSASPFTFSNVGATQRQKAALFAWVGATLVSIQPDPANDGIAYVAYKVTNPSPGVWHYEYAVYNQNLDRAIQSFSIPTGNGVTLSNVGFHAPPQHPGWAADGTVSNLGYSSTPWQPNQGGTAVSWSSEPKSLNDNANAIRWGTLYNFRFDSNRPPTTVNATVGFFKTGSPIDVQVQGPAPAVQSNVSVSGRVLKQDGTGISGAYVFLNAQLGTRRYALTNPFGYYQFDNVQSGQTYSMFATSRFYTFPAAVDVVVNDNITNRDFVALP
ncbi:MAG: hypothetical protein DMF63_10005 [Acidobacteria bacterium]|nr:MAG: hypothetical protein DMF63_10005 [Acidobacteriota bacterium]